jgi:hypothetical protein
MRLCGGSGSARTTTYLGKGAGSRTATADGPVSSHNRALWIKGLIAAGNCNANVSANPATNTNGVILGSGMTSAVLFVGASCNASGDSVTFNFGASAYIGTQPAGFGNW